MYMLYNKRQLTVKVPTYTNVYINFPFICSNIPAAPAFSAVPVAQFFVFCVINVQGAWYSLNMVRLSVL
jgi:hypothetical protein